MSHNPHVCVAIRACESRSACMRRDPRDIFVTQLPASRCAHASCNPGACVAYRVRESRPGGRPASQTSHQQHSVVNKQCHHQQGQQHSAALSSSNSMVPAAVYCIDYSVAVCSQSPAPQVEIDFTKGARDAPASSVQQFLSLPPRAAAPTDHASSQGPPESGPSSGAPRPPQKG